ncbi:MAG: cytochrome c biogenesis heme-transporting ATPase CcmA [Gammaproteobacteria bacterium]|nr:cytochrome c biogenesis heme-transporting ATPase CcmA [Gammaproteobacteria bacterium]MDH5800831.1 cytochrome c biogenesis heme-transporting ATPase CcmA [Gammaproteobacteria bacterium]
MLEVKNLQCVRGDHCLFTGLNFSLDTGELIHLRGSNGSGKTSLLRTICGLMVPADGEVLWNGESIARLRDEFFQHLLYFGHLGGIKGELSATENLQLAFQLAGANKNQKQIETALADLGLAGREDLPTKVLSQGQKRRVALARLLLTDAVLWVLDEPFTALDVAAVEFLKQLIVRHVESGGMVILTTHQEVEIDTGTIRHISLDS